MGDVQLCVVSGDQIRDNDNKIILYCVKLI